MADVTISKFSARVIRQGTSPANPGNAIDEVPDPLTPIGLTTYLGLGDTSDSSYLGKNGFVPVVSNESVLTLQPLPQIEEYRLISGGIVQWTGSGYVFNVSGAIYRIAGIYYESDPDQVTLTTPDPTNDRIDVIAVDNTGAVVVITGTASATPVKPQVDPTSQLELTSILVIAASSDPVLTEEIIYDQNTEWTGTSSGTGTANFASTTDPYQGSVSVETTNIQNGFYIQFNNGSTVDITDYQTIGFFIKLKASIPNNQAIFISFFDGSLASASNAIPITIDKTNVASYQFVGINLNSLVFTSNNIQYVRFTFVRAGGPTTYSGYFMDLIKLEGGINPPLGVNTFTALQDTPSNYTGQGGKVVAVKSDESGLEFVTGGGGGISGSGTANEIAYFTGATAIASLSTATYPSLTELSYVKGVTSSIQTQLNAKPTAFLGLTDTPSAYTSQANKWVRVNGTPDALIFDTISPYDLDQEGATDGQVLTWSTANSRYEPQTFSGSSNWTITGSDIYRLSGVGIQTNTIPANTGLIIKSPTVLATYKMISVLNNAGTEFFGIRQDGTFTFGSTATYNFSGRLFVNTSSAASLGIFDAQNSINGACFTARNSAGTQTAYIRADGFIFMTGFQSSTNRSDVVAAGLGGTTWQGATLNLKSTNNQQILTGVNSANTVIFSFRTDSFNLIDVPIVFGTATGTKLGTATSQKIGFWNATPVIQQTTAGAAATFVANTSGIANDTATFDGYTIGQVVRALRTMGLLA